MLVAVAAILGLAITLWGGVLVARLIANRLEHGMRWWRARRQGATPTLGTPASFLPPKRSAAWTLLGIAVMAVGALGVGLGAYTHALPLGRGDGQWLEPLLFGVGAIALGLSAGLFVVGWRFDPARGRRRCAKCWYDMSAVRALRCPECGHEPANELGLYRPRRSRITLALACAPLLACLVLPMMSNVKRYGAIGLVPTTFLIAVWERLPEELIDYSGGTTTDGCLAERRDDATLWSWQKRWYKRRCAAVARTSADPRLVSRALGHCAEEEFDQLSEERAFAFLDRLTDSDPAIASAAGNVLLHGFVGRIDAPPGAWTPTPLELDRLWQAALGRDPTIAAICAGALSATGVTPTTEQLGALDAIVRDTKFGTTRQGSALLAIVGFADQCEEARATIRLGWRDPDDSVAVRYLRLGQRAVRTPEDDAYLRALISEGPPARAAAAAWTLARLSRETTELLLDRIERDPGATSALASNLWEALVAEPNCERWDDLRPVLPRYQRVIPILARALEQDSATPDERVALLTLTEPALPLLPHLRPIFQRHADDASLRASVRDAARRALQRLDTPSDSNPTPAR